MLSIYAVLIMLEASYMLTFKVFMNSIVVITELKICAFILL